MSLGRSHPLYEGTAATMMPWFFGHRHRGLGSVFLVLVALGHAVDVRLVQAVDLPGVFGFLREHFPVTGEVLALVLPHFGRQLAFEFAHQAASDRFEPPHAAPGFFAPLGMLPPALGEQTVAHRFPITPPQFDFVPIRQLPTALDDPPAELRVGRIRHRFLLHR